MAMGSNGSTTGPAHASPRLRIVERALDVLDALAEQPQSTGVIRLGEQLGLPGSSLHRLLGVLVEHGLATQDADTRRYRLGPRVMQLSQAYRRQNTLEAVAQPHLQDLRDGAQETVFLTQLVRHEAVCIATAESPRPLQFFMRPGQTMPYHAAASARVILAYRPAGEAERLLRGEPLDRYTSATRASIEELLADLPSIRAQGWAVCDEEMEVGVAALSAPIHDGEAEVTASVTIVAPAERLAPARRPAMLKLLLACASAISADLGYGAVIEDNPARQDNRRTHLQP
ncbi:MAG: IclR family transcriptional regulator [Chloroflexi bacterium]|nr:IclR family transcriptional regulator [Chloroflexota bacterium]